LHGDDNDNDRYSILLQLIVVENDGEVTDVVLTLAFKSRMILFKNSR
jgi:hypothetical protein